MVSDTLITELEKSIDELRERADKYYTDADNLDIEIEREHNERSIRAQLEISMGHNVPLPQRSVELTFKAHQFRLMAKYFNGYADGLRSALNTIKESK